MLPLTPDLVLKAYACGIFPMAESRDDPAVFWVDPERRGIIPLEHFHLPRRLARTVRQGRFDVRVDSAFREVILACSASTARRRNTWINDTIVDLYSALNERGFAHSVECWRDERLVGGLYGVSIGGAFFGESMFSDERDASKVALAHLVERLRDGRYVLLDTQFVTTHLRSFGAIEISRAKYLARLKKALTVQASFYPESGGEEFSDDLQSSTQIS